MVMKILMPILFLSILLFIGSYCLFFPKKFQAFALRSVSKGITAGSEKLRAYIESDTYLIFVRVMGLFAYSICALMVIAFYRGIDH
jgi:hypothetical protein